jgi:voltage-gated sodium channel type II alpha
MVVKQDGPTGQLCESKLKQLDSSFIDNNQRHTVVDMKGIKSNCKCFGVIQIFVLDVKVLNDIIEQAAASGGSEHGGKS